MKSVLLFFLDSFYIKYHLSLKPIILIPLIAAKDIRKFSNISFSSSAKIYLVLLGFSILNLPFSFNFFSSIKFAIGICFIQALLVSTHLTTQLSSKKEFISYLLRVGFLFNISSLLLYLLSLLSRSPLWQLGFEYDRGIYRLTGLFEDPNFFCLYNSLFFFLTLDQYPKGKRKIVMLSLILINTLLTFSITGLSALTLSIAVTAIVNFKKINSIFRKTKTILLVSVTPFFFYIFLTLFFPGIISSRIKAIASGSGRFKIWSNAIHTWSNFPLFGSGTNTSRELGEVIINDSHFIHSSPIEILAELGLFGGFLLALLYYTLLRDTYRISSRYPFLYQYALFFIILSFGISIHFSPILVLFLSIISHLTTSSTISRQSE